MPLNVVSNYAANVAHRNLQMTDAAASRSLAKLSIGQRVVSARDDAASMAVGSRLNSEVQGLKQAVVNAGQANSMLQIADGAMGTVSDILTRMKTLAVQSSSGNLSDTERSFLDVEFQALLAEIDRVAADTDFGGTKLVDGSIAVGDAAVTAGGGGFAADVGVAAVTAQGVAEATAGATIAYASAGATFTVSIGAALYTGSIGADLLDTNGALTRSTTVRLTTTNTQGGTVSLALNTAFDSATDVTAEDITFTGTTELDLSFKLGTGSEASDSLSFSLKAVSATGLGMTGTESIETAANAESALEAIGNAIDNLNGFRADVGAAQNRLEFASGNLSVAIENAEAARSTLLDLDIAAEMTAFTSKQILMQSGVAMLAQANQMPQNLLRLLQ